MTNPLQRCFWCGDDPLYVKYHDREWGVPVHDDRVLFEFLILEGAQAGLSWITILRKRESYRKAFAARGSSETRAASPPPGGSEPGGGEARSAGIDPAKVARFDARKTERLLQDPGIVRNRLKIASAVKNARAFLKVQEEFGSFAAYQWRFVDGHPVQNRFRTREDVPAKTAVSDAFSKDLQKREFSFVGSTIIYAYMQAVGMVNDHLVTCFRHRELART